MTTTTTTTTTVTCLKRRLTALESSSQQQPLNLLDCQSLQSSLKRVRLSCSPGELRLQRDLKFLGGDNPNHWYPISDRCWNYYDNDDDDDDSNSNDDAIIQLHWTDSLRLVLQYQETGRIWIQIPRMYPHRPPTISRIEGLWMERIVVHEAAPDVAITSPSSSSNMDPILQGGNTIVFPHWSPVMNIGTLLEFCIRMLKSSPPNKTMEQQEQQQGHQEEKSTTDMDVSHPHKFTSFFPPNRFDLGFEKSSPTSMEL
eukprot:scaffold1223_cov119-Cylindrotheca_fusiformis.AAC.13